MEDHFSACKTASKMELIEDELKSLTSKAKDAFGSGHDQDHHDQK